MEPSVEHTYEHWGFRDDDFRYEVTLSIENERCSDFVAQKLTLLPPEPISIFRADNYRSCSPLVIKFFNDSKFYLTDRQATAFEWRLNNADEPFSTEFEPTLTITEPGYYNIGLRVYGDGGEKNYYRTFRVFENPVARFEVMPERVLLPNAKVHFFNLSENANKYVWDFGDGTPKSSEKDPVHIYDELGEYRVSLMAFAEYEHKDDDGNLLIHECIDYDSRFPAVWVEGEGKILFPNAFMPSKLGPNGGYYDEVDYKNEVFHPVADGVIEYRLMIFNRWGEQIFESNDIKIGWDGYYKGKLANQDVYVWRAVGKFSNGELFDVRGNVTLLR
jgi:gliding motility-associated-like protein